MVVKQMNKIIKIVMAIICLLHVEMLNAQDTLSVSLSKALEIALSQSPTIKVANKEIERVDYSKKEKYAGLFPTISGTGTYNRNVSPQAFFIGGNMMQIGVDNSYSAGIVASLPIISPTLWASLKMTELEVQLALESARSSKISLINQVTKAYYGILLTQDSYNVFKHSFDNTVENARIIQNKYKQGTVSEFEWIRADVQVRNAKSNLVTAESAINMSILQLKMLLGVDMFIGLKIQGSLVDFEEKMYGDVLSIDTTTLYTNTDLNQFDLRSKQLNHSLKTQKAGWWPTLSASFNYIYNFAGNDGKSISKYQSSMAGLTLSVPLFQGGARLYKEKQIMIQIDEMKYQRDNLCRSLELQILTYLDNIKKAIGKIESNKEGLRQAEKAVSISQKRYEVGSGTYLDLTNTELAYIQAGLFYNQSVFDYLSAKADIEKLLSRDIK